MADEGGDEDFEVIRLNYGRYTTAFHVSQHYYGYIIGKKGMTKRKIESDTQTEIKIPRMGQEDDITILGSSAANVKMARRRVNMIITSARSRQDVTHFVSIPLNKVNIVERFKAFKSEILEANCDRNVNEDKFILDEKLHQTVCVMCLMDNQERTVASDLLREARDKIIIPALESKPLDIHIKGISFMGEDPHEVHVLYATLDQSHPHTQLLQKIADDIYAHFYAAGYAKSEKSDRVKLHMTLINSRYGLKEDRFSARESFDASRILDKYKDYDFGVVLLREMHLSQFMLGANGYYEPTCIISCTDAGLTDD